MCGLTVSPFSTAFFASRPAASSTPGFDVFVHEVIAAISTSPLPRSKPSAVFTRVARSAGFLANPFSAAGLLKSDVKVDFSAGISMRSCGRFGPASEGLIVERSSESTFV